MTCPKIEPIKKTTIITYRQHALGDGIKTKKRGQTSDIVLPSLLNAAATYSPTCAVPSARSGLTSLFGMGRGGALTLLPPEYLYFFYFGSFSGFALALGAAFQHI